MTTKYPWETIKKEYVEAPNPNARPLLESLAQKYGCNPSYLRSRASKEKWLEQANLYLTKIQQKRIERKTSGLAYEQSQFDTECINLCRSFFVHVTRHLKRTKPEDQVLKISEIDGLTKAVERIQKIGRMALGDDTGQSVDFNLDLTNLSDEEIEIYRQIVMKTLNATGSINGSPQS